MRKKKELHLTDEHTDTERSEATSTPSTLQQQRASLFNQYVKPAKTATVRSIFPKTTSNDQTLGSSSSPVRNSPKIKLSEAEEDLLRLKEELAKIKAQQKILLHELRSPINTAGIATVHLTQSFHSILEMIRGDMDFDLQKKCIELVLKNRAQEFHTENTMVLRETRKKLREELSSYSVNRTDQVADYLTQLGIFTIDEITLEICLHPKRDELFRFLKQLISAQRNLHIARQSNEKCLLLVEPEENQLPQKVLSEKIDLRESIEWAVDELAHRLQGLNLTIEYPNDLQVSGPYKNIQQVWVNLLSNAIEACTDNARININVQQLDNSLYVVISDNGPGIPAIHMNDQLFESGFSTKKEKGNHGIGLSVCKNIIDQYGGEIRVNSVPGSTRFTIQLPL